MCVGDRDEGGYLGVRHGKTLKAVRFLKHDAFAELHTQSPYDVIVYHIADR